MKAVTNTSTLVRFYRARGFLKAFRNYYSDGILVPLPCWNELMRSSKPENVLMKEDATVGFISIVEPSPDEERLASHLIVLMRELADLRLDAPNALAIAIAEQRGIEHVLSDDHVALAVPRIVELHVVVLDSLAVLKELAEESLLGVRTLKDFEFAIKRFQMEAHERFSHKRVLKALRELSGVLGH